MRFTQILALAASLCIAPAYAQEAGPSFPPLVAQELPAFIGETIPLPTVPADTQDTEQWNRVFNQMWVRNVSRPALYVVRPPVGRSNGRAVIVVPGGGYSFVSFGSEGIDVANRLAANGYTALVLKYRHNSTPRDADEFAAEVLASFGSLGSGTLVEQPMAMDDLASSIDVVRAMADDLNIDPDSLGVIGFSAGAHTTIRLLEERSQAELLDHVALIYPPLPEPVGSGARPDLFYAISVDDPLFQQSGLAPLQSWLAESNRVEFHLFSGGGHGFGMRPQGTTSDGWIEQYLNWLELQ
ncbi:conserved hypothetical protein [Altererythrobacter sp. B11]|uniref:alpha/beta hydrolase n=1 Tax=Altererythrobacter sp. B11 TaxID=2060312 RepID=UPI000DC7250F|nr:alpha/beta hydrolase [Altererythrobacter sp. B11]BBC73561.1 conserved hypothetical protein [Altererythrobacter sp. B11]